MNFTWLNNRLNRFKYRPKRGQSGMTAVLLCDKHNSFENHIESLAASLTPSRMTNAEVLKYIKSKYDLKETALSEGELNSFKINYILNMCPDVLHTPEINLPKDKNPTRRQFLKHSENASKRFQEAAAYPIQNLGLDISAYSFEYIFENGNSISFQIICENANDDIFVYGRSLGMLDETEIKLLRKITNDIIIFKGISQNDIDKRTNKFIEYAAALIEWEQ